MVDAMTLRPDLYNGSSQAVIRALLAKYENRNDLAQMTAERRKDHEISNYSLNVSNFSARQSRSFSRQASRKLRRKPEEICFSCSGLFL